MSEWESVTMGNAAHRAMMLDYYAARDADELRRERETGGYEGDLELYEGHVLTFKEYLIGLAREDEHEEQHS